MGVEVVLNTLSLQQKPITPENSTNAIYKFQRNTLEPTDTLSHSIGWPHAYTGMIRCDFRPSDDAVQYPYLVPANAMAVVELSGIAKLIRKGRLNETLAIVADKLASEIDEGIANYGVMTHPISGKKVFAYEVDGLGNAYFADDANVPSLLSLPYLGYTTANSSVYLDTRAMLLSRTNPWYFSGTA